jgi:hypothetical protein
LWPQTMHDFLVRRLRSLFTVRAYSLNPRMHKLPYNGVAYPQLLPLESEPIEGDPFKGLIRIDEINAHNAVLETQTPNEIKLTTVGRKAANTTTSADYQNNSDLITPNTSIRLNFQSRQT